MKKNTIEEKIKDWHVRICIAILGLISIFMFVSSFSFEDTTWTIPWWFAFLYSWCGLVVSIKLSDIWYRDKK